MLLVSVLLISIKNDFRVEKRYLGFSFSSNRNTSLKLKDCYGVIIIIIFFFSSFTNIFSETSQSVVFFFFTLLLSFTTHVDKYGYVCRAIIMKTLLFFVFIFALTPMTMSSFNSTST